MNRIIGNHVRIWPALGIMALLVFVGYVLPFFGVGTYLVRYR